MNGVITPEEFKEKMIKMATSAGDPEIGHSMADELMCKILCSLGYGDGVKIFEEMDKWYS